MTMVSLCPGFVSTNMLPDGVVGKFIKSMSFPPRAGILAPMAAIIDPNLKGGEFLTNFYNVWTDATWSKLWFGFFTTIGLRSEMVDFLALWVLMFEGSSYGYHINTGRSAESKDEVLARQLYDWTEQELRSKGFLPKE